MRVMSAVTAMPVARYSPRAPAELPTAVSATSRSTETLTWQSGRANRSTRTRPMRINVLSEASAVRSKNVEIDGRLAVPAPGNTRSTTSPSSADARALSRRATGSGLAAYVPADEGFLDAHVRRPFGYRQRELAALPTPAAHLIPGEVAGNVIDAVERLKQIARQHDVFHQLGDLAVANHVAPAGRERKILEHRLAAERTACVHAERDVADEIVEPDAVVAGGDVGVRHADDGRMPE